MLHTKLERDALYICISFYFKTFIKRGGKGVNIIHSQREEREGGREVYKYK
jgi:hypothetical protein